MKSICYNTKALKTRPVGQAVKTLASHAENMGSIPVRVTNKKKQALQSECLFLFVRASHDLEPTCAIQYVQICRNLGGARGSYTSAQSARGIAVARRYTKRLVQTLKSDPHF